MTVNTFWLHYYVEVANPESPPPPEAPPLRDHAQTEGLARANRLYLDTVLLPPLLHTPDHVFHLRIRWVGWSERHGQIKRRVQGGGGER